MSDNRKPDEQIQGELDEAALKVNVGGHYAHYKHPEDKRYKVIRLGIIENGEKVCVIYENMRNGWVWVRSVEDFVSEVEVEGKRVKRFDY